jgi:hypothetical protein
MRFDPQGTFHQAADSVDFLRRNIRWPPTPAYEGVDTGRRHNAQHPVEAATNENIVGKKREHELFLTVLPSMDGSISGKEYLESLA